MNQKQAKPEENNHVSCDHPKNYVYDQPGSGGNDYAYFHDIQQFFFIKVSHSQGQKAQMINLGENSSSFSVDISIIDDPGNTSKCTIVPISPTNYRGVKNGHISVTHNSGPIRSGTVDRDQIGDLL